MEEALQSINRRLQTNPSPLGLSPDTIVKGLRLCMRCNCIEFNGKFYLPNRGVATGTCPACDFSDIWVGDITKKHLDTNTVRTIHFMAYRDDIEDLLLNREQDKQIQ